ncbi:hypothetical protein GRF61_23485 [Azoarcus sp. TTM-91]|uniref:hypothetical protein n=1 Tax=Azoarcus sp. TTM-91 TaxID=2691581 RepID=UPI00145CEF91|nr:hypothetical protein [Azoarcus sp. TTM-91]NMG37423.1 hypothetical protein [Azoarcus sp. TTM-91]
MGKKIILISTAAALFSLPSLSHSTPEKNYLIKKNKPISTCGIKFKIPENLISDRNEIIKACLPSNQENLLSLGALFSDHGNPNWIDRFPFIRIKKNDINEILSRKNYTGIKINKNKILDTWIGSIEEECSLTRKTIFKRINGKNWEGWIAEDQYSTDAPSRPTPEYCSMFLSHNRCIRMIIGNSEATATMGQNCFTRQPENFDLAAGLSYDLFIKIVKSIEFEK